MKVRCGYVSNSSSSSFIVKEDVSKKGVSCIKLSEEQLELLDGYKMWEDDEDVFHPEKNQDYYLTEYISDCDDKYTDIKNDSGYSFEYSSGGHWGPYDEDEFNEYSTGFTSVWLYKFHDTAKQMSLNKFVKKFKEDYAGCDVIVKHDKDKIILTIVR